MSGNTVPVQPELDVGQAASLAPGQAGSLAYKPGMPLAGCRALVRYAPCRQTPCHLTVILGDEFWWAKLHDLCAGGVGLLLDQPVEVGGFLFVELTNASGIFSRTLLTRVVHLTKHARDGYLLGGEFVTELAENELRLLLT